MAHKPKTPIRRTSLRQIEFGLEKVWRHAERLQRDATQYPAEPALWKLAINIQSDIERLLVCFDKAVTEPVDEHAHV